MTVTAKKKGIEESTAHCRLRGASWMITPVRLVAYNDDGDVLDSDGDEANASRGAALAQSDDTASEMGSPELLVHPSVANLLRGGAADHISEQAEKSLSLSQPEGQPPSEPLSQQTDYGAALSPAAFAAFDDVEALHVELASA